MKSRRVRQRLWPEPRGASIPEMVISVYTSEKAALVRRTWLTSVFLLLVASTLAATVVWRNPLAARITPDGWSMSFRPPRSFQPARPELTPLGSAFLFAKRSSDVSTAFLVVHRIGGATADASDAREVCERVLKSYSEVPDASSRVVPVARFDRTFGARDAVEISDPALASVVRAVLLSNHDAYAVFLRVIGSPIDKSTYRLFDLTCQSAEFRER